MIPHLSTALRGPLLEIEKTLLQAMPDVEHWLRGKWQEHAPPFYGSVDLRNSGFKLAPVDTNLFPGGFNNLNPAFHSLCVQAAMVAIEKVCPGAKRVLLIPENHTRNVFYLQNVWQLQTILQQTGLHVRIGSLLPEITQPTRIELPHGQSLSLEPLVRTGNRLSLDNFDPCAILLNNDLSAGVPDILRDLQDQVVLPPLHAGWAIRRKSNHFSAYNDVAQELAQLLKIDPWLINSYFRMCGQINFQEHAGEECLAANVDALLEKIESKYKEYGISEPPFVIVKANAGTYGMGIMTVKSSEEVRNLNRKQRNKMSVVKEGLQVHEVLIQEGVYTFEAINEAIAEPVVYMIDRFVVGGFYRVHANRGNDENLNAPGMEFVPLAFENCCVPDPSAQPSAVPNRFYAYGVIARLALLAASIELERTEEKIKSHESGLHPRPSR